MTGKCVRVQVKERGAYLLKHLILSAVSVIIFFLILETGFRLWGPRENESLLPVYIEPDPNLVWRLSPRSKSAYATNELGLRDDPLRKDADITILLLGDSVSWGDGVLDRKKLFASLLEARLSEGTPDRTIEVINSGVPGYSTFQELAYLKGKGLKLKPDLVLLQFCLNDVFERYHTVASYGGSSFFKGVDTRSSWRGLFGTLVRASRFFSWYMSKIKKRARTLEAYEVQELTKVPLSPEMEAAWKQVFLELEEIYRVLQEENIPLYLYISPYEFQLHNPERFSAPQRKLSEYAQSLGIPVLDALPEFSRSLEEKLFWDANHYSESGHRRAAEILGNWLAGEV